MPEIAKEAVTALKQQIRAFALKKGKHQVGVL